MSNAITCQPNRLSMRYSSEKQSEEDLIKVDDESQYQEQYNAADEESPENPNFGTPHERVVYKEDTFCDYMSNICQCTSWLCANLVSSIVLCFENCIDFVHTCKCNTKCCCDVCGGSEDSLENKAKDADNARFDDLSGKYEDEYTFESISPDDTEEALPDSCVTVEEKETPITDGEKLKNMSNKQNPASDTENIESSSL